MALTSIIIFLYEILMVLHTSACQLWCITVHLLLSDVHWGSPRQSLGLSKALYLMNQLRG